MSEGRGLLLLVAAAVIAGVAAGARLFALLVSSGS